MLLTVFYALNNLLEAFKITYSIQSFIVLITSVIGIGIIITLISTWFALNKYLRMKLDDLY